MTIKFPCVHCGERLRVPDTEAGRLGKCNKCGGVLEAPHASVTPVTEGTNFASAPSPFDWLLPNNDQSEGHLDDTRLGLNAFDVSTLRDIEAAPTLIQGRSNPWWDDAAANIFAMLVWLARYAVALLWALFRFVASTFDVSENLPASSSGHNQDSARTPLGEGVVVEGRRDVTRRSGRTAYPATRAKTVYVRSHYRAPPRPRW